MVKVLPKNDAMRKLIKHPIAGAFRAEGAAEWPSDSFTARRIADGDVTVEEEAPPAPPPSPEPTPLPAEPAVSADPAEAVPAEVPAEEPEKPSEKKPRSR
jgi:hypothetical protein